MSKVTWEKGRQVRQLAVARMISAVIARLVRNCALERAIKYSRDAKCIRKSRGVLGRPVGRATTGIFVQRMDSTFVKFALPALIIVLMTTGPAAALEQNCRFIQAKADREACYKRQEEELAARRKPAPTAGESKTLESLRQMRQDDEIVYRSIHGICRGC